MSDWFCTSMIKSTLIPSLEEVTHLIDGCLKNDRICQAKIYNYYSNKMMTVCTWYARNREEAEEILHDGFVRVFTYLHKYRGEGSFEGWIRKIMVNAALSKYRNKNAGLYVVSEYNPTLHDEVVLPGFSSHYDEKELLKMVNSLSPGYRMVFNLFVFEGFNHTEIAKMMGISKGTSKSNLSDARKILQANLVAIQIKETV